MKKILLVCTLILCPMVSWAQVNQTVGMKVVDPAFDEYVSSDLLRAAASTLDPNTITDVALRLAKGEAEMLRSHHAISADDALQNAWRIATIKGDTAAQERIKKVLAKWDKSDLIKRFEADNKLAGMSRSTAPKFSVKENTMADSFVRAVLHSKDHIVLMQDRTYMDSLVKSINYKDCLLADNVKKELTDYLEDVKKTIPETADPSVVSLKKLLGASRIHIIPEREVGKLEGANRTMLPPEPGETQPWDKLGGGSRVMIDDAFGQPYLIYDSKLEGPSRRTDDDDQSAHEPVMIGGSY